MRVFVAGGSGSIGIQLVRALVAAGHRVVATTRTPEKQKGISTLRKRTHGSKSFPLHSSNQSGLPAIERYWLSPGNSFFVTPTRTMLDGSVRIW